MDGALEWEHVYTRLHGKQSEDDCQQILFLTPFLNLQMQEHTL